MRCLNTVGTLIQAFFIMISLNCVMPFRSTMNWMPSIEDYKYTVESYPELDWFDSNHVGLVVVAVISICVYLAGFLSACFFVLYRIYRHPEVLNNKAFRVRWRWLMFRFAPEYWLKKNSLKENFRVLSEMRGKILHYNPMFFFKIASKSTKMQGKWLQNLKIDL